MYKIISIDQIAMKINMKIKTHDFIAKIKIISIISLKNRSCDNLYILCNL